jgi:branched-chain amino acid aminotransferase
VSEQPSGGRGDSKNSGPHFPTTEWIWRDGEFIPWDEAHVHVMSHVVHYGSSIFEGIRRYRTPDGPAIFRPREHLRRFLDSGKVYRMPIEYSIEELRLVCHEVIERNELEEGYIRPLALRGYGAIGVHPAKSPMQVYVICWPWGAYLGADGLDAGVDVCVSSWQRAHPNTFPAIAKAGGNYLSSQLMTMEARINGYNEAIGLSPSGLVSEGSGQNVFLVRDGALFTPPIEGSILPGITRDCVITIADDLGIPCRVSPIPRERLYTSDELFFSGTASEVTPIRSVDRIPVGDGMVGPITRRIQDRYLAIARGEHPDVHGWLEFSPARNRSAAR